MVSNEHIEIVNNYTLYVGVKFSANGYFTNHKENSTEKNRSLICGCVVAVLVELICVAYW